MTSLFSQYGPLRWLVWLGIGVALHLCAVLMNWLLVRSIDLSDLNPLTYSDFGWILLVCWHLLWIWMWVNE
jgi:hypothetical protein